MLPSHCVQDSSHEPALITQCLFQLCKSLGFGLVSCLACGHCWMSGSTAACLPFSRLQKSFDFKMCTFHSWQHDVASIAFALTFLLLPCACTLDILDNGPKLLYWSSKPSLK